MSLPPDRISNGPISFSSSLDYLNKKEGKTILFITHEMRFTTEFANRTIVMADGKVWMDGPTQEVFLQSERLGQALVTPPEIVQLSCKAKSLGLSEGCMTTRDLYRCVKEKALGSACANE